MDNLTHSIAGLLMAETALQWRPRGSAAPTGPVRWSTYAAAVFTNNLPDLDFVYTGITPGPLGYLLHHRGHTHTLVIALLLALATFAALAWWLKRRPEVTAHDRRRLLAVCGAGAWTHIAMDYSNNYGVHPFWPWDARWFYGDAVFIVEPWFWVLALPPLIFAVHKRWSRVLLMLPLGSVLALAWAVSMVPWGAALALTLGAALALWVARRASEKQRVLQGVTCCLAFFAFCVVSSHQARANLTESIVLREPGLEVLDVALTPAPANPLCFSAIVMGHLGERYLLQRALVAPWPALLGAHDCRAQDAQGTAPMVPMGSPSAGAAVRWQTQWSAPSAELRSLAAQSCEAAAALRFLRAPSWLEPRGERRLLGDLRYDSSPGPDFADVSVADQPTACPRFVPPWVAPRGDLLNPR